MNLAYYGKCMDHIIVGFWLGDLGLLRFRYMYSI